MSLSDNTRNRTAGLDLNEYRKHLWLMVLTGVAVGMLATHFTVVRPMKQQLDGIRQELIAVRTSTQQFSVVKDQFGNVSTLMDSIISQQKEINHAQIALNRIRRFRADVEWEAEKATQALAALDSLTAVEDMLIARRDSSSVAAEALDEMVELNDRLIEEHLSTDIAEDALGRLVSLKNRALVEVIDADLARNGLEQLSNLKLQLIAESDGVNKAGQTVRQLAVLKDIINDQWSDIDSTQANAEQLLSLKNMIAVEGGNVSTARNNVERLLVLRDDLITENAYGLDEAQSNLNKFVSLKDSINDESFDVEVAQDVTSELLELKDEIVYRGLNADTAHKNIERLMILHGDLAAKEIDVRTAGANLEMLLTMQSKLTNRSYIDVADAVRMLDIMMTFNEEFREQVNSLQGLRRSLLEIVLLENTAIRAIRVLEPLIQIGNLRNLKDEDAREAARVILNRRSIQIGETVGPNRQAYNGPVDARIGSESLDTTDEAIPEGFVPPPLEDD